MFDSPPGHHNLFPESNLGEGGGLLIREAWFESRSGSQYNAGVAQLVEHHVANVNAESSSLFARPNFLQRKHDMKRAKR